MIVKKVSAQYIDNYFDDTVPLTLAPTGVRATLVPTGGADNRPPEISKTKQARDTR